MLVAATRENEDNEWHIKTFTKMVGAHRVDQKTWTEEDALEHGLYTEDIKPFTSKPELTKYQKYGIATVVDGRVVWPALPMDATEIEAVDKAEARVKFAACQCAVNGECLMMEIVDWHIANGTPPRSELSTAFLEMYDHIKELQEDLSDA